MNNAKIWLVVKPTVGIPLFLSAVAVGSFAVHVAVLSKVTWYNDYLIGQPLDGGDSAALVPDSNVNTAAARGGEAPMLRDAAMDGMVVTLPDGRKARLIIEEEMAMATPLPPRE